MSERAAEDFRRSLVDHGLGLMCVHDHAGTLWYINPAAARALGYTPAELTGRSLASLLHSGVRRQFDAYIDRIWKNGRDSGLMRLLSREGRAVIWSYRNLKYEAPGRPACVLGHAHEVTEEKIRERGLRQRDARYRSLVDGAGIGIGLIEFEGTLSLDLLEDEIFEQIWRRGRLAECNQVFARTYGARKASDLENAPVRHFRLLNEPRNAERFRTLIRNGFQATEIEADEVDREGRPMRLWLSLSGIVEDGMLRGIWCLQRELGSEPGA